MKYCIKIGFYDPNLPGMDLYDAYEGITLGKRCPGIDHQKTKDKLHTYYEPGFFDQFDRIVCSPALRGIQTAQAICDYNGNLLPTIIDERLHEIYFSLHALVNRESFMREKSIAVRRNFITDFCANRLLENHDSILQRRKVFDEYANRTLFVSHSFFMKCEQIIRLYGGDPVACMQDSQLFLSHIPLDQKTFDFCAGFVIS